MKFDIFYQLPAVAGSHPGQRYMELLEQVVEAERLGFHGVWLAEAHFMPNFSLLPAPMLLLAALAQRTTRLRLGMAVNLLPLHHPVRLAEESAMLDILSSGRLEFGAGRSSFARILRGYQVPQAESRPRFNEALEFIRQAWLQQPRLNFVGQFFHAEEVEVMPRPVQVPHPPIRMACNTAESFINAGRWGYPIFAAATNNPPVVLDRALAYYHRGRSECATPVPPDWLAYLTITFPGADSAAVRRLLEPTLLHYFQTLTEYLEPLSDAPADLELHQKRLNQFRAQNYESILATLALIGEPAQCVARVAELRDRFGISRIVCWFEVGGLAGHREILGAMRLLAERVMPHFA